ncbi:phage baseplate assembly protein V [Paraburkholderia eburnea]|uniref:Phage baseplate assembly protein V n=1 Tax=Paraburkholderia eburnea TaxID=1189126 RepID=A0A2S4LWC2_9BURK|nr:phage baseplate assembly protein V [Paraburkholderia eburnea]POR46746.1 phage baseplate assembly protein V [Paraburkholderia eburnea]PRZ17935.1 phage baseplate assembly protein V [Paraburkholderia eburnea]
MDANESRRQLVNMIRKGSVFDINLESVPPTCRVSVGDPDDTDNPGLVTNWIPFFSARAGTTREWNPLTKGEKVLLLCPMGDPAQGVALAGLFDENTPQPSTSPDKHMRVYPDDAVIEYDHAKHALAATLPAGATVLIVAPGTVTVKTEAATVQADTITLDGDATVTKSLTVKGPLSFEAGMTGKGGDGDAVMKIAGGAEFAKDVKVGGISSIHHRHREQGDGELVSEPQ